MLKITTEGRKAALDLRLMKPELPDDPQCKVNLAGGKHSSGLGIHQGLTVWRSLCFAICPRRRIVGFSVYRDMADKLKRLGVPENDIAFIQDYDADNAKLGLFRSVRAGKVRILIRQHAENGVRNERPGALDCAASSGCAVATRGRGAARRPDFAAGK
jgi:hypothetical protein